MSQSSENNLLRFGCPACGIRLVVDQSIAGTEGPCPSCGARIVAPPLEVSRSLTEKQAAPVNIKPRGVSAGTTQPLSPDAEGQSGSAPQLAPEPMKKPVRRSRSVSPTTALSEKHQEKKNLTAFFKMLVALMVVVGISLAVYYFLKQAN